MALVLNIETATTNCSVSLSKDGETLVLKEDNSSGYSHAETLHLFIDEVFKISEIKPTEIDAIAVSKGPGSYTGLRIGVSSAKGLCFALNKPLIAISTLVSLAHQLQIDNGLIIPMLDARRMEVYSAIYNSKLELVRGIEAEILTEESYNELLKTNKVYFIGNGVEKTKGLIQHPNAIYVEGKLPSANEMALLAEQKYKKSDTEDVAYFEPYYLKDFVALKKKN
ncbi:tRNA (adenosine(37)-N6)-threonylcarbamoyltransferase complex dimerization subunit type 1 TsaB [Winogradskyella echinorum]|uniref:tRNA (Adenosine(37)-N6)-threonylcarbamoyltransferase complex dimerization subunit type 1 TsaB n=1 Tax=Winogradskyella echinorum TaxID=538189 RepID=A0ABR6Y069_9FLAO|nr:tRNA (adenosine(37)-N6)-threonylcarbamoyltransferase complex dimerization subunit type 1 TsaB [Winogradskyella echinorum]MBC3846147.1 tRNA (adenosine(37)-N6)-threonylcarbamoyltransferase complex dimerization subunit type 1 TsaB [Winogradskyella echinorum]MBC5750495.1 tRNA (adenosine(37)-N6)-threonylcarbamoyltransferase complex dimerization subunit type 1 TsaB [Winogradskyella echinorum]